VSLNHGKEGWSCSVRVSEVYLFWNWVDILFNTSIVASSVNTLSSSWPSNPAYFFRFSYFLFFFSIKFTFESGLSNTINSNIISFSLLLSTNLGKNNRSTNKFMRELDIFPFMINILSSTGFNPSSIRKLVWASFNNHVRDSFSSVPDIEIHPFLNLEFKASWINIDDSKSSWVWTIEW